VRAPEWRSEGGVKQKQELRKLEEAGGCWRKLKKAGGSWRKLHSGVQVERSTQNTSRNRLDLMHSWVMSVMIVLLLCCCKDRQVDKVGNTWGGLNPLPCLTCDIVYVQDGMTTLVPAPCLFCSELNDSQLYWFDQTGLPQVLAVYVPGVVIWMI